MVMPPTGNLQHSVATSIIIEGLDHVLQPASDQLAPSFTDKHVRFALERVHFDLARTVACPPDQIARPCNMVQGP